jgi:hypothetical protein
MKKIKIEVKWAVIFSLMTLVWMTLEKITGLHDKYLDYHISVSYFFAIPAIWVMVLAIKNKKFEFYNGIISYKQGLVFGIILSVFIAILSPITQWIISYIISPDYFKNVIKYSIEMGYYKSIEEAEAYFNYKNYAFQNAIAALFMGIITTAIAMIFIKSNKNI